MTALIPSLFESHLGVVPVPSQMLLHHVTRFAPGVCGQPWMLRRSISICHLSSRVRNQIFVHSSLFHVPLFWQITRLERHGFNQTLHLSLELTTSLLELSLHCLISPFEIQSSNLSACTFAWFSQLMITPSFCATKMLAKFRIHLMNCVPSLNGMPLPASCQDYHLPKNLAHYAAWPNGEPSKNPFLGFCRPACQKLWHPVLGTRLAVVFGTRLDVMF